MHFLSYFIYHRIQENFKLFLLFPGNDTSLFLHLTILIVDSIKYNNFLIVSIKINMNSKYSINLNIDEL